MAFVKHGALTIEELVEILELDQSNIIKRMTHLRKMRIVVKYAWGGNDFLNGHKKPTNWKANTAMYALDPRHPFYHQFRHLARHLNEAFPLPGTRKLKWDRHYKGPREPIHALSDEQIRVLGDDTEAWMLMLLARTTTGFPIETISTLLGVSRGTHATVRAWARWGIVKTEWGQWSGTGPGNGNHRISLDRSFVAYDTLRRLACKIDNLTGGEFKALSHARLAMLNRKRFRHLSRLRRARKNRGKSYFLTPTGFQVTGWVNRWKRPQSATSPPHSEGTRGDE